jgi:DNA (cytosine-5)-methyltransferase 1
MDIDGGRRIALFRERLQKRGYTMSEPLVLNAVDFGVPQYRERLFVVGNRLGKEFELSIPPETVKRRNAIDVLAHVPEDAHNHVPRDHAVASILRYRALKFGAREQLGRVDRLHPFRPSKTVIAGGTKGGGRSHLHPFVPRTLTVRECARLQTFPDSHIFTGPSARQFTQVGNAIPPLLAYHMAASVYRSVFC